MYVDATPSGEVAEGTAVTLTCSENTNSVVYQYEWLKGRLIIGNSSTLTLESIQKEDSGLYYCRVSATIPNAVPARTITWATGHYLYVKCKSVLSYSLLEFQLLRKYYILCKRYWFGLTLVTYGI